MATGGSLMGKADTTLVSAAFREGQSNVQKDLGDVYTKREASFKTFQKGISTIFENLGEEDKKEKDKLKKGLEELNANPGTWDALLEVNDQVANQFKNDLKAATTDLEKQKLWGKFNNYSELSKNNDEVFNSVIDLGVTNQLLTKAGSDEQKLLVKMVDDYKNNTKITNPAWDAEKGDIVYTDTDTSTKMTLSELQSKVGRKDNTVTTDMNALIQKAAKNENNQPFEDDGDKPGFRDDLYNDIFARLNSSDVANAGIKPVSGMKYSVQDMLMGKAGKDNPLTIELFDILGTLDIDGDGTPGTAKDASYVTSANAAQLAKEIMNNDDLYKEVIATVVTNMSGKKAYNISQAKKGTETEKHLILGSVERQRYLEELEGSGGSGAKGSNKKIDLGVSRLTNQRVYATRVDVKAKYDQIIGSKKGDAIEGWDGKKTYQYLNRGNGKWQYQVWDSELQQFVTKGGDKEAAGGGEGTKIIDINSVIGELIPQTMLQNSNKTKFTW